MVCPITHELIGDPVIDPDGYSYEKEAILKWLQGNSTSPVTRTPLSPAALKPNRALADTIEEYRKQHGLAAPTPSRAKPAPTLATVSKDIPAYTAPRAPIMAVDVSVIDADDQGDAALMHVKIKPPVALTQGDRPPVDICFVLDNSGSMSSEAKMKNDAGVSEGDGLSLLDVVRHGVKTVLATMQPSDRVAVVKYSSTASVVHNLIPMSADGKTVSGSLVDQLTTEGTTNLWDGLRQGLDVLHQDTLPGRTQCLMLLTDGCPNVEPPRGHIPMLQKYIATNPAARNITINTFGFGYSLRSDLLHDLAVEGRGSYSFIPDVGFVGTAFIHSASNVLTVCAKNVELQLGHSTAHKLEVLGGWQREAVPKAAKTTTLHLGAMCFEQTRDVIVRIPTGIQRPQLDQVRVRYTDACTDETHEIAPAEEPTPADDIATKYHFHRSAVVDMLTSVANNACAAKKPPDARLAEAVEVASAIEHTAAGADAATPMHQALTALATDVTGQVAEGLADQKAFDKWGKHYFRSLLFAHRTQLCNNFKDPGVQLYGGAMFSTIRDIADDLFDRLPEPKRTLHRHPTYGVSSTRAINTGPINMARYNCAAGGCIAGHNTIVTPAGLRRVDALRRGDKVVSAGGVVATVRCVVVNKCATGRAFFVRFPGGALLTPYHPVRDDSGAWVFPQTLHPVVERECSDVYNLVLDQGHIVVVNGVDAITLGHGRTEGVLAHPYLGTTRVVDDLAHCRGWALGRVHLARFVRDPATKLLCGVEEVVATAVPPPRNYATASTASAQTGTVPVTVAASA